MYIYDIEKDILCTTVNVFTTPLPSYATQIINPYLTLKGSQPIKIKGWEFSQSGNVS